MDRWTDRLSAYLDDELGREERAELEAHLGECTDCRQVLEELRAVLTRARSLDTRGPAADLWPAILTRIEADADVVPIGVARAPRERRFALTLPQLVAAGVALMLTGAATSWFVLGRTADPAPAVAVTDTVAANGVLATYPGAPEVESRLAHLEALLDRARAQLDPETIAIIEKNLAIVQAAVDEAERALAIDPANEYLRAHLDRTLRTKVDVLERATALAET